MKGITCSLISGFMAATASLCGKFSMAAEETLYLCEMILQLFPQSHCAEDMYTFSPVCQNILVLTRVGFFIAMLVSNILMWTMFTKALRLCSTTLEASVTNTATNFFFTAVYGQVFFGESLSLLWWLGTMMIIFGLMLIHQGSETESAAELEENKNK